jgi:hypothetical protein
MTEESKPTPKRRRKTRTRPTPRWLNSAPGVDEVAKRRCLLLLSVLSGEVSVTEAIAQAQISRQLYYLLEERALLAMLQALSATTMESDSPEQGPNLEKEVERLRARVKRLEAEKRRADRLLFLTRKVVKPGVLTTGRGRKKTAPSSTPSGPIPSPASTSQTSSLPAGHSSPPPSGATQP